MLQTWRIARHQAHIRAIEASAAERGLHLLDQEEIPRPQPGRYRSCHVIGSGWSLAESIDSARPEDAFVLGFNFACLSGLAFDQYFIEFGGPDCSDIAIAQRQALLHGGSAVPDQVFFKNLWQSKNDLDWASDLYGDRVRFIKDLRVQCWDERFLGEAAEVLLQPDPVHLRQYVSTALTMIVHARNLGFERIVLHGVDFGGLYFFDLPEFRHIAHLRPPASNSIAYSGRARKGADHATNRPRVGIRHMLPYLRDALAARGVQLLSASESSPLSEILPLDRPTRN